MAKESADVYRNVTKAQRQTFANEPVSETDSSWMLTFSCGHQIQIEVSSQVIHGLPVYTRCDECTAIAQKAVNLGDS